MDPLRCLADLRVARTDDVRLRAAKRLREAVRAESRSGYSSSLVVLYGRLQELLTSDVLNDKIAGVRCLKAVSKQASACACPALSKKRGLIFSSPLALTSQGSGAKRESVLRC